MRKFSSFKNATNSINQRSFNTLTDFIAIQATKQFGISEQASSLQIRLCVIAHTSSVGQLGIKAALSSLETTYEWKSVKKGLKLFVNSYIHCLSTTGGNRVSRPFGSVLQGTSTNVLIQFDRLNMRLGSNGDKCILMIRDVHSGYSWLYPQYGTDAQNTALALRDRLAAFGVPKQLMSDGSPHYKNETIRMLTKGLCIPHHFRVPSALWSNMEKERFGKKVLRFARTVLSEVQQSPNTWPSILPLI